MRIGFLTMTFNNNYGGMLQAFSIMTFFKKHNYDITHLNVQLFRPNYINFLYVAFKRILLKYLFKRNDITWIFDPEYNFSLKRSIEKNNLDFIEKNIFPTTEKIFTSKQLKKHLQDNYDVFIVGSDQVWRPKMYKFNNHAFFKDVKDDKIKMSLSASFGVDYWEYSEKETKKVKKQISKFNAVSVREDSGVVLCKKKLGINAIQLLDPTFLISKNEYQLLIQSETKHQLNQNIELVYYLLDETIEKINFIEAFSQYHNFKKFKNYKSKDDISNSPYPHVFSWLDSFDKAKFIITDSYHGCVFSIIFNKPFLVFKNDFRGNTRIESLLRVFNLEFCYISDLNDFTLNSNSFSWDMINLRIKSESILINDFVKFNLQLNQNQI